MVLARDAGRSHASGFFDAHQRRTIAAAMARIIPTDNTPGAIEAGTIDFVDRYLSGIGYIYAKPDGSGFERLAGRTAQAWQQRIDIMRAKYIAGIADLDKRSHTAHGADFPDLTPAQQDAILSAMEHGDTAPTAGGPALQQTSTEVELDFLPLMIAHTRQGFYADPIYGGNRDRVGWDVIGFPGPTSLAEVHSGRYSSLPWFAPGHTDPNPENREVHHGA